MSKLRGLIGAAILSVVVASPALAQHGHFHGGHGGFHHGFHSHFGFRGGGFFDPFWWGYPYGTPYAYGPLSYPYYPYADVYPAPQAVPPVAAAAPPAPEWYYCPPSKSYYPYVRSCAVPWHRVPAVPPQ